jgi:hypothetical protein
MCEEDCPEGDIIILGPRNPDGSHEVLRHHGDCVVERGTIKPVKDGQPIQHELVELTPKGPRMCSVRTLYRTPGPPKVTSDEYREGWGNIWGKEERCLN